ncbi:hypothetical protein HDV03_002765 [Kappamyces sp. JEL0829]|nr:hypothetical protein HDV03_002765 [Kappamyces sp. JEL0829]
MINPQGDESQIIPLETAKKSAAPPNAELSQQQVTELIDGVLTTLKSKFEDLSGQILGRRWTN